VQQLSPGGNGVMSREQLRRMAGGFWIAEFLLVLLLSVTNVAHPLLVVWIGIALAIGLLLVRHREARYALVVSATLGAVSIASAAYVRSTSTAGNENVALILMVLSIVVTGLSVLALTRLRNPANSR
jgi:hypothetical protein